MGGGVSYSLKNMVDTLGLRGHSQKEPRMYSDTWTAPLTQRTHVLAAMAKAHAKHTFLEGFHRSVPVPLGEEVALRNVFISPLNS